MITELGRVSVETKGAPGPNKEIRNGVLVPQF